MIRRLLIANRGEIACRVIATARAMGIHTIAVYSDADAMALHVTQADEAHPIGPADAASSYLNAQKILQVAKDRHADAIHPGYGFLSENPEFAEAVTDAGLRFVGPSASVIRSMGRKDRAKEILAAAGVPVVPGDLGADQNPETLAQSAQEIGYPVLIKARSGGGGKGMRLVETPSAFSQALEAAKREAMASFGDDHVIIEKYIQSPRHIEVQIFGDDHGNVVHLFERDCSMQRRHQKVIEEAPAPGITDAFRTAITRAAVTAAQKIGYSGAGTVEFIADGQNGLHPDGFWFMEMNTRLQVEHPVTEAVTGLDLVEWQLRVASGEALPVTQEKITCTGHAIEARLYAEDPQNGFMPAPGKITALEFGPARVDTGVQAGDVVSPHYDPMIAKMIVHAPDRKNAISALSEGLNHSLIGGVKHNLDFLSALLADDDFAAERLETTAIDRKLAALAAPTEPDAKDWALAAVALIGQAALEDAYFGFQHFGDAETSVLLVCGAHKEQILISRQAGGYAVTVAGEMVNLQALTFEDHRLTACCEGTRETALVHQAGSDLLLRRAGKSLSFSRQTRIKDEDITAIGADKIIAPMTGVVTKIDCKIGDVVGTGTVLAVMEAMKMELSLTAQAPATITKMHTTDGASVSEGTILIEMELADG